MPNAEKVKLVAQIKQEIQAADAVWVVDYRGLSVRQSEDLRRRIRTQNAAYKIYKNTFTILALGELGLPDMKAVLEGPSAFVFVSGDPVDSAKVLKTFAREHTVLKLKGGLLDGKPLSAEQVTQIADLPTREELLARLLATMAGPLVGLVRVLNGNQEKLARALQAIADTKAN
ncbi:MAG: 50S ribosomal protein L10 [Coriobacteriales bacterium]|jgi:large subunit ribosomal protein L10|nr:50S ribosomal protein L10 [Coriobacteriales bacterium]